VYEYIFEVVSKLGKKIHVITVYTTNKIKYKFYIFNSRENPCNLVVIKRS
jgi:hypothetical protein